MKAMIYGFVAIAVLAVAADLVLSNIGFSSQDRTSGDATRLDAGS